MSVIQQARTAYDPVKAAVRTPKSVEYEAFARVTRLLKSADGKGKDGYRSMVTALHENRRLWTVLAASVADGSNALPAATRASLFYLAEFTESHSRKVIKKEADVGVLLEINAAIMGGLRAQGAES